MGRRHRAAPWTGAQILFLFVDVTRARKEKGRFVWRSLARDLPVVPEHAGALRPNFVAVNNNR